jgi:hypothetical protein
MELFKFFNFKTLEFDVIRPCQMILLFRSLCLALFVNESLAVFSADLQFTNGADRIHCMKTFYNFISSLMIPFLSMFHCLLLRV